MVLYAPPNPNPGRISDAIWRLWTDFDRYEPSALLGGIYASKPGYHNYRNALGLSDYSVGDLAADRRGNGAMASALDITLNDEAMKKYTTRLDVAARARDRRLYTPNGPVLREFIGTKNNSTVYCYVLTGGVQLGVGADAGPDPGRPESHLWHIHLSIIRQFCEDWGALRGVLSVLMGQSINEWESDMDVTQAKQLEATTMRMEAQALGKDTIRTEWSATPADEAQWMVRTVRSIGATVQAIATALPNVDDAVAASLRTDLDELTAAVSATPAQVVAQLTAIPREEGAQALIAAIGKDQALAFAQAVIEQAG